jgi:hypothetical protein
VPYGASIDRSTIVDAPRRGRRSRAVDSHVARARDA